MKSRSLVRAAARWGTAGVGIATGVYGALIALAWTRYGQASPSPEGEDDSRLDRFIPTYDVVERHRVRVAAPAAITLSAAKEQDLLKLPAVRAIFRGRELILGSEPSPERTSGGLLAEVQALGWVVLDEIPGREVVVGAVTKPWEPNVAFRSVPPESFAAFSEPDYVKIVWTLRADPTTPSESILRTETRAVGTDAGARAKFRRYWSFVSPGIFLIRYLSLAPVKAEAERRARRDERKVPLSVPDIHDAPARVVPR